MSYVQRGLHSALEPWQSPSEKEEEAPRRSEVEFLTNLAGWELGLKSRYLTENKEMQYFLNTWVYEQKFILNVSLFSRRRPW